MEDEYKMCPRCNFEITELEFDVTGTCGSSLTINEVKKNKSCYEVYDLDDLMINCEFDNFRCPECQEILFFSEEQAKEFLKS